MKASNFGFLVLCLGLWVSSPDLRGDELDRWVWRNPQPFGSQIWSLVHGDGLWLALANSGQLATSIDGIEWDLASLGTNSILVSGAHGNGRFVAGSSRGPFHSYDGHNWFKGTTNVTFNDMTFAQGHFTAVHGASMVWRSAD